MSDTLEQKVKQIIPLSEFLAKALRAEYVRGLENGLMYAEAGALDELRAEIERAERGDG